MGALCQPPHSRARYTSLILGELLVILALVLVNGLLAGAEIAIVAFRRTRVDQLVDEGRGAARAVKRLRGNPERFLATVQIGITVVGATAGAFGGSTFAHDLEPILRRIPAVAPYAEELALAVVVTIVSYLSLVLGELVPKSLGLRYSERYALLVGRPLVGLASLARPLVWLLTASSNVVLRIFGDRTTFTETRLAPEELQQLVGEAAKAGSIHPAVGEIASRAIDFADRTALHVMVPRKSIVALALRATAGDVERVLRGHPQAHFLVYDGTIDDVVGYVQVRDLAIAAFYDQPFSLESVLRVVSHASESTRAVELLDGMQRTREGLVVVVDESGALSGIVTLEDLLEELVGEIFGEEAATRRIEREERGSAIVRGDVPVHELNRELGIDLPESRRYSTVAGLCLELAEHIPEPGERLRLGDGTVLEVVDASPTAVRSVRIVPARRSA